MHTGYRRQPSQQAQSGSNDPGWLLIGSVLVLALCLIALPWIIAGFLAERSLARWLHWRLSLLVWLLLLLVGAFILSNSYQHGLQGMITHELADYVSAAKHYQTDIPHWPLRLLWSDTWPVWLRTLPGIGIAGFCAEVYATTRHKDTTQTLRQDERRRRLRAQRSQHRARSRSSQPKRLPDEINGVMMMGIPIDDDTGEEA